MDSTSPSARSGPVPIRAPLSPEDRELGVPKDPETDGDGEGSVEEGFETASDTSEEEELRGVVGEGKVMPKARVSGEDEVETEVFEEEGDGDSGFGGEDEKSHESSESDLDSVDSEVNPNPEDVLKGGDSGDGGEDEKPHESSESDLDSVDSEVNPNPEDVLKGGDSGDGGEDEKLDGKSCESVETETDSGVAEAQDGRKEEAAASKPVERVPVAVAGDADGGEQNTEKVVPRSNELESGLVGTDIEDKLGGETVPVESTGEEISADKVGGVNGGEGVLKGGVSGNGGEDEKLDGKSHESGETEMNSVDSGVAEAQDGRKGEAVGPAVEDAATSKPADPVPVTVAGDADGSKQNTEKVKFAHDPESLVTDSNVKLNAHDSVKLDISSNELESGVIGVGNDEGLGECFNSDKLHALDAKQVISKSNELECGMVGTEIEEKLGGETVPVESMGEEISADKVGGVNGREGVVDVVGHEREEVVSEVGGSVAANVAEGSEDKVAAVDNSVSVDNSLSAKQEDGENKENEESFPVKTMIADHSEIRVAAEDESVSPKQESGVMTEASVEAVKSDVGVVDHGVSEKQVGGRNEVNEGSASVHVKVAENSENKFAPRDDSEVVADSVSVKQKDDKNKVETDLEEPLTKVDEKTEVSEPEVNAEVGDLGSEQVVDLQPVFSGESKSREAVLNSRGSHAIDDDENVKEAKEEEEGLVSDVPGKAAILERPETAKQIIKELEGGSSSTSPQSGFGSSRDLSHDIDGQIASDSEEEVDTDEEGDGKELFDSAALAALLKAATGASPDGSVTISSEDSTRVFTIDRPAGLGSSVSSLKPLPARSTRPNIFTPTDLAVTAEPENNMDEEEKKLHEKVEMIRVKFLRLIQRLGHSPEDTVAAQVLYRLSLAEGISRGRQMNRVFSLENAKKKALQLEAEGREDLEFSCNILVLGKTGVGKSATINSIFGEEKTRTNAFEASTTYVREISGIVDGVKIRVVDTPGLKASAMEQTANRKILSSIKKYTKRCSPDIVLYVDRLDTQTRDFNDLPLLRSITSTLGSSIWFNAIVALTHAASAPPDGPSGSPLSYEVFIAQRSHIVQQSIRQAASDMRLMNPVALVENHPSCRKNREGEKVLPNGLNWRSQMLLLCYSSKILSEANALLKLQDSSPGKLFGFRMRSPPLPFLLSSLLQSRSHPKLQSDQGIDNVDSDIDLDDLSDSDQDDEEDEYDQLPPFKPLRKAQIAKLSKEQKKAYFEEYDYRVKLLQKKQWKEEIRRLKEMKKRGKAVRDEYASGDMPEDYEQDGAPAAVPVPLPDMVLPPTFDGDNPTYRYRFLEPNSQLLTRPVLDTHGWDHDCGYDGVSIEESLTLGNRFPGSISVQITKDKKDFSIHLDSSLAAKHGETGSTLAGLDIQTVGKQLAYIVRSETKFKNFKKNKTTGGISVTFLGENVATGLKIEDQITIGKRVSLVASTGAIRSQGDTAYGANLEARLREKDYPIGQVLSTLGLSLMRWRGDLALGANLHSQLSVGRNSKVAVRAGLNNKLSGQITIKTSSSEQLQIALVGLVPLALGIFRSIWPGELYSMH